MSQVRRTTLLVSALVVAAASGIAAHHSGAMFDRAKPLVLMGTVKEFRWVNPHAILLLETDATAGEASILWAVEFASPGNMTRMGWSRTSVNVREPIEVTVFPM